MVYDSSRISSSLLLILAFSSSLFYSNLSTHVVSSVELKSFGERRFLREFDEGKSFWFSIRSRDKFNVEDISTFVKEFSNIRIEGVEGKTLNGNLKLSFFIIFVVFFFLILHFLLLFYFFCWFFQVS